MLTNEAHSAARIEGGENQLRGDEERWPSIDEIRTAQESMNEVTVLDNNLVLNDGLLADAEGHIFVPADPPHLRARLLVIAHAGAAGHRGQRVTERHLKNRFVWSNLTELNR